MKLTIRSFSANDVGTYHCVSTNSLGRAEGTLRLYGTYAGIEDGTKWGNFRQLLLKYSVPCFSLFSEKFHDSSLRFSRFFVLARVSNLFCAFSFIFSFLHFQK